MGGYEQKWWMHFVSECYFDTVLVKKIFETKERIFHKKGCFNVINEFKTKSLKDDFGVGIIDKDKREIDYLKECDIVWKGNSNSFNVWKHKNKHHYIIQLNPPLEEWILERMSEMGLSIEEFEFPAEAKALKKKIKNDLDSEQDEDLKKLVHTICSANNHVIEELREVLLFLKKNNYNTDFKKLSNG